MIYMSKKSKKKEWWEKHFNEKYIKTYIDIATPEKTKEQVDFLVSKLKLKKGTKLLDLACGTGRHSILLAKEGIDVTGFDYSKKFITIAKQLKNQEKLKNITFVQGDMRKLKYKNKFDVVINMFTAFGYFEDESYNLKVLENIYSALKPNGKFLIDLNNEVRAITNLIKNGKFKPKEGVWMVKHKDKQSNRLVVITVHKYDPINHRFYMSRSWQEKGRKQGYHTSMRTYSLPELSFLLKLSGFKIIKVWGDFNEEPLTVKSRRMIILAEK